MSLKNQKKADIFIIKSEFNRSLVKELYESALIEFKAYTNRDFQTINPSNQSRNHYENHNQSCSQIQRELDVKSLWVPGAGEIPQTIKWIFNQDSKTKQNFIGVLALGVIIRGKTPHFDFLKDFLQTALWDLQKNYTFPIVFSILMLEDRSQFKDRVIRANEGMKALLKMIHLKSQFSSRID